MKRASRFNAQSVSRLSRRRRRRRRQSHVRSFVRLSSVPSRVSQMGKSKRASSEREPLSSSLLLPSFHPSFLLPFWARPTIPASKLSFKQATREGILSLSAGKVARSKVR